MKRLLLAAVLIVTASCNSVTATVTVAGACKAIAESIFALSPSIADGTLSDATTNRVVALRDASKPFCAPGSKIDPGSVVGAVTQIAADLAVIVKGE